MSGRAAEREIGERWGRDRGDIGGEIGERWGDGEIQRDREREREGERKRHGGTYTWF